MFEVLEGQKIRLRKAREDDHLSMLKHVWGDEAVYRWMLYRPTLTEEAALDRCRRSMDYQKEHYAWFAALKETDEAIGLCAIRENEPGHFEESGICIGAAFQGKGYATEMTRAVIAFGFDRINLHRIEIDCRTENTASQRVIEKCGLKYEGVFRDFFWRKDHYDGRQVFSILKQEWTQSKC